MWVEQGQFLSCGLRDVDHILPARECGPEYKRGSLVVLLFLRL